MYAVYAYIGVVLGVNVGIYGIHGVSGIYTLILLYQGIVQFHASGGECWDRVHLLILHSAHLTFHLRTPQPAA